MAAPSTLFTYTLADNMNNPTGYPPRSHPTFTDEYTAQSHSAPRDSIQDQGFAYPGQSGRDFDGVNLRRESPAAGFDGWLPYAYPGSQLQQEQYQAPFPAPPISDFAPPTLQQQEYYKPSISQDTSYQVPNDAPSFLTTPSPAQKSTFLPMATPALPQTQSPSQPPTPASPNSTQSLDQARIDLILSINQDLLAEVSRLQSQNAGGATSPAHAAQLAAAGQDNKMASEAYIQLLRRVQGNLAYLMPRTASQSGEGSMKTLPGPAFMLHPPEMPSLAPKYEKLRALFPDWPGNDARLIAAVAKEQAALNSSNGASGSTSGS